MSKPEATIERVSATQQEIPAISKLVKALNASANQAKLIGLDGEEIELPESIYHLLRHVLAMLESGQSVTITPATHELSTQEAADILNVSRPFLYKLLAEGQIPYYMVGTHKRIKFEDLILYQELRDHKRREGLKRLTQMSEAMGLYDDEEDESSV
jgi:excisionase family DNA binding protein